STAIARKAATGARNGAAIDRETCVLAALRRATIRVAAAGAGVATVVATAQADPRARVNPVAADSREASGPIDPAARIASDVAGVAERRSIPLNPELIPNL
ncbi:MAG: hypothetical protein ABL986_06760, partial [Vicinamibacterales bacterium]